MLPFRPKPEEKILMLAAFNNEVPGLNYGFDRLQREGVIPKYVEYTTMIYNENTTKEELKNQMKGYDYIVVISEIAKQAQHSPESWQSNIPQMVVDIANENNQKHVVLSIAKPYDLDRYKNVKSVLLTYGAKGMDPTEKGTDSVKTFCSNIPTSLDIIFGKVTSSGKLPVDVSEVTSTYEYGKAKYPFGHGLTTSIADENPKEDKSNGDEIAKEQNSSNLISTDAVIKSPNTGDRGIFLYVGISIIALVSLIILFVFSRKSNKK